MRAERGRIVGITAASAGPKSWPTAEKMKVMTRRCTKSPRSWGTSAASGMAATDRGAAEVAPKHDLLAIQAVRDHPGRRREQHRGHRVGEQRDRDRRAPARDLVGEDDQGEQEELVGQLGRKLRKPDVPERGVAQDGPKAAGTLDVELERIGLEWIGHRRSDGSR